jgi:hypothetical protein
MQLLGAQNRLQRSRAGRKGTLERNIASRFCRFSHVHILPSACLGKSPWLGRGEAIPGRGCATPTTEIHKTLVSVIGRLSPARQLSCGPLVLYEVNFASLGGADPGRRLT